MHHVTNGTPVAPAECDIARASCASSFLATLAYSVCGNEEADEADEWCTEEDVAESLVDGI